MTDPCHVDNLLLGPDNSVNRIANCAALGIPSDFISQASFGTRRTTTSGNVGLLPEVSDSFTAGIVYTPIDDLNIAIDYWDIEIEDAITRFNATDILENIVDAPIVDENFLSLVERDATHQITNIFLREINAAKFSANGTDLDVNYSMDLDASLLRFSFKGTYLDERLTQQNENFPDDVNSQAGEVGFPHFRALFSTIYNINDLRIGWTVNYIGESTFDKERKDEYFPDWFNNKVKAVTYHNLNLSYDLNEQYQVSFGVNNLTDEEPEILPGLTSGGLLYDAIGRRYYLGFRATL